MTSAEPLPAQGAPRSQPSSPHHHHQGLRPTLAVCRDRACGQPPGAGPRLVRLWEAGATNAQKAVLQGPEPEEEGGARPWGGFQGRELTWLHGMLWALQGRGQIEHGVRVAVNGH